MIYISGPGHGGPAMVANTYLEGTYSELYPNITEDEEGMQKLFRQFSFPGGIPSHVAPETPGSIHEGGELGYALAHAYGAAFDNPDLIVACVVGDGEAETGPLATALALEQVPQPGDRRRRPADPPPERLQDRQSDRLRADSAGGAASLLRGYGYKPYFVGATSPKTVHQQMAATVDAGDRRHQEHSEQGPERRAGRAARNGR